jgi:hypothetical protein
LLQENSCLQKRRKLASPYHTLQPAPHAGDGRAQALFRSI